LRTVSFPTTGENPGELCLPASNDVNTLGPRKRDILVAHTRMACMISGLAVPGSKEFLDAFIGQDQNNLQTAIGTVKVTQVVNVDDQCVEMTFRCGSGPTLAFEVDHGELNKYVFVPATQLLVVPGAVEKQFPTYVHNHPTQVLSQQQKDDIAAYCLTLEPWI